MPSSWGVCQGAGSLGCKGNGVLAFGEVTLIARVAAPVGNVVDRDFSTSSLSDSDRQPLVFSLQHSILNSFYMLIFGLGC